MARYILRRSDRRRCDSTAQSVQRETMNRFTCIALMAMTCGTLAWLGPGAPAQAATVIDTFELKGTVKEFCEGNPKFIETIKWVVTDGVTLIVTRDVNGDGDFTDIQATANIPDA